MQGRWIAVWWMLPALAAAAPPKAPAVAPTAETWICRYRAPSLTGKPLNGGTPTKVTIRLDGPAATLSIAGRPVGAPWRVISNSDAGAVLVETHNGVEGDRLEVGADVFVVDKIHGEMARGRVFARGRDPAMVKGACELGESVPRSQD
jgi:hypothetical protein